MNITERLIAWLSFNQRPCEERDLLNDALEELTSLTARLAEAEAQVKQLKLNKGNFRRLLRNMRRADEAAKGGRDDI